MVRGGRDGLKGAGWMREAGVRFVLILFGIASCVAAGASKAIKSAPESTTVAFAALTGLPQSSDDKFFYFCDP